MIGLISRCFLFLVTELIPDFGHGGFDPVFDGGGRQVGIAALDGQLDDVVERESAVSEDARYVISDFRCVERIFVEVR